MIRAVLTRKNRVLKTIRTTASLPPSKQSNESMCMCYVLAFGALEYMIETTIRGWIQHHTRKHKHAYPGKIKVDTVLVALNDLAEFNISRNNGIKYDDICVLVERLAGTSNKNAFKAGVTSYAGGAPALKIAITRIETTRHNIAHGALLPDDVSPNLSELEKDFLHIYNCLITNLDAVLPRT